MNSKEGGGRIIAVDKLSRSLAFEKALLSLDLIQMAIVYSVIL